MKRFPVPQRRPGFTLVDLLVAILVLVIAMGLLLPAALRVNYEGGAGAQSQNNLKQIGLAIHNWAASNNGRFWAGNGLPNAAPVPPGIPNPGKGGFWVEILPFMEGDTIYSNIGVPGFTYPPFKPYQAPLDSTTDFNAPLLSYGLNGYLVNLGTDNAGNRGAVCTGPAGTGPATPPPSQGGVQHPGTWWAHLPGTFNTRGTSFVVGTAQRLAQANLSNPANRRTFYSMPPGPANVAGYNLVTDTYFYPPHISTLPVTSAGFNPGDATAFTSRGVWVQMMDGSVRIVAATTGGHQTGDDSAFDIACSLNNVNELPDGW